MEVFVFFAIIAILYAGGFVPLVGMMIHGHSFGQADCYDYWHYLKVGAMAHLALAIMITGLIAIAFVFN